MFCQLPRPLQRGYKLLCTVDMKGVLYIALADISDLTTDTGGCSTRQKPPKNNNANFFILNLLLKLLYSTGVQLSTFIRLLIQLKF